MNAPVHSNGGIDTTVAHPARRYNYWMGGKDNFEADRRSADEIEERMPTIRVGVRENRNFMHRAARFLARRGVHQFFDIGTGIPAEPNLNQIVQEIDPSARVVYVDNDPVVLAHGRALMTSAPEGTVTFVDADLRDPVEMLAAARVTEVLDWRKPIGLTLIAVLHFLSEVDDPAGAVATLVDALPAGSWVVASHATGEYRKDRAEWEKYVFTNHRTSLRDREAFRALFDRSDVVLLEPGTQSVTRWWNTRSPTKLPKLPTDEEVACNGLVGRIVR